MAAVSVIGCGIRSVGENADRKGRRTLFMRTSSYRCAWTFGLILLFALSAAAQTWRQVGPPGGDVQSLSAVPGSARTLFLGSFDGHIFGSRDAGEHWELLG